MLNIGKKVILVDGVMGYLQPKYHADLVESNKIYCTSLILIGRWRVVQQGP